MTRMQITQMILNTKKQEYRAFGQSNVAVRCKTSTISDPVKLSEYEIEITAPKGGACDARVITIDLKAKKIVFIAYDGDRTNVKETYTVYKANFE